MRSEALWADRTTFKEEHVAVDLRQRENDTRCPLWSVSGRRGSGRSS
jgi:hypothetical protein